MTPAAADPERATVEVGEAPYILEGSEGSKVVPVTLTRRGHRGPRIEVHIETTASENTPQATPGSDYDPEPGTVVFPAGARDGAVLTFNVPVYDDAESERYREWFDVIVRSQDATVARERVPAAIYDNEPSGETDACHCFISGIKVYGCVPGTECEKCCSLNATGVRLRCKERGELATVFATGAGAAAGGGALAT